MQDVLRTHTDLNVPRALVDWESSEHPVLSVYADWRVSGRGLHEALTPLRKGLHDSPLLPERGPARDSFEADAERIRTYLDEVPPDTRGLAIFACAARGLWTVMRLAVPPATVVHLGIGPLLLPLAEATQDAARGLVALVNTTTVRLIALDHPAPRELSELHEATWGGARSTSRTGWRNTTHQRAYEHELQKFAEEAAETIATAAHQQGFVRLALAGDEVAVPAVRAALPSELTTALLDVEHIDMQATADEVEERVWPDIIARAREQRAAEIISIVTRAAGSLEAVAAVEPVLEMLRAGRVDTVAIDPDATGADVAETLLCEALAHGSRVLLARALGSLASVGGVAATLR